MADDVVARPTLFGTGGHCFCGGCLGLRSVRTSARCSLDSANTDAQKGTYNDYLTETNFFLFLGGNVNERAQEIEDRTIEDVLNECMLLYVFCIK